MIRAVFFDAAGTLFGSREPIGRIYAKIARAHGLDAPEEVVGAAFRRAFHGAPELAFGGGHSPAELRRLERQWWRARVAETFAPIGRFPDFDAYFEALFAYFADPANWIAFPEAAPTLGRLKECGMTLGVISNFDFRVYRILEGLGLVRYFDSITISSEAGRAKPHREIFEHAMARHGVTPGEAMHVGDSARLDFAAARDAGMAAVLIDRERGPEGGVAARISSLSQAIELCRLVRAA